MRAPALIPALLLSSAALADVPTVVTDITPVHGLVAMVMGDLGSPSLLVEPGASPHGYALRPSQAAALQGADAVFWIGHELAPWLDGPLSTLAGNAEVVELLEVDGTILYAFREEALFGSALTDDHDAHDEEHEHEGIDPHAWLDPENARLWLTAIARTLSRLDPENAPAYQANAATAEAEILSVSGEVSIALAPLTGHRFVTFHDAFQYFEHRFGLSSAGAISLSDASSPSAARVAEIRDAVTQLGVVCIFSEPQFNPGLVATVAGGTELTTAVIDPLGTPIEPGAEFYPTLIRNIAESVDACLSGD